MKKRRPFKVAISMALLIAVSIVRAQPVTQHLFSIQQAVEYAKKNNTQVKNALLNVQIQEQENRGVTAAAYPTLSASGAFTDYLNIPTSLIPGDFVGQPGTYIPVKFGTKYIASGGLQLNQLLFDGQVFVGLQARAATIAYQKKAQEVTEESIKVNIYKIYYQLVVSKTQLELLDSNISRLEKLKHDANEMFKNGFAERLDVDKLDVQLTNIKTEKKKALNDIEVGYLGLKTLIGMPIKDGLTLTDRITETDIKTGLLADSAIYTDRKEYQYLQIAKQLNEYNVKRYKLSYYPTLSMNANYSKQAQRNQFDFFNKGDWFTTSYVGVNLAVPIFSGFAKDAKVKQSKLELQQVENSIDNLKLSIDNDLEAAKLKIKSAIETMDFQKKNMELAEKVYYQTKKKFEAGLGSNTEINTAQIDLKTAQTSYISALYDAIIAKVDYLKATGKL